MSSELRIFSELTKFVLVTKAFKENLLQHSFEQREGFIVEFRSSLRAQLLFVQNELAGEYGNKITSFILFPIISNIDEKCKLILNEAQYKFKWQDLQVEFFQRSDGGEYVFEILDEILSNKIYPKLCYEVLLIVLQGAFLGKYYQNPNHIERQKYITSLKEILSDVNNKVSAPYLPEPRVRFGQKNNRKVKTTFAGIIIASVFVPFFTYLIS
ncbi:DotU family type IV/VI secretion system protein [Facilibium subflavum]|uniref:DotU family type IV/VI secretion system protein n=1 Tax=Facilibium subflavum TaxID=2219058 RepID=UPI000E65C0AE|nr:DotU family type IV/VI secretion system protein [Facilibium subflavum]